MDMMQTFRALAKARGVAGVEGGIRELLREMCGKYDVEITDDAVGNLIVRKKGPGKKVMLCAHMDSIGFIVTFIDKDGYVHVTNIGGAQPPQSLFKPVRFYGGAIGTVIYDRTQSVDNLKVDDLYVDIGADNEEQARKMVKIGERAVFESETYEVGNKVISPVVDNRMGCYILLETLERVKNTDYDVYYAFTTQEEVGLRGSKNAAYSIAPDVGIAVDVTASNDTPGYLSRVGEKRLGDGAAIMVMDNHSICTPELVDTMIRVAERSNIKYQLNVEGYGGTDTASILHSRGGVRTGGLSIVTRNPHTPTEVIDKRDIEAITDLLVALLESGEL